MHINVIYIYIYMYIYMYIYYLLLYIYNVSNNLKYDLIDKVKTQLIHKSFVLFPDAQLLP